MSVMKVSITCSIISAIWWIVYSEVRNDVTKQSDVSLEMKMFLMARVFGLKESWATCPAEGGNARAPVIWMSVGE